MCFDKKALSLVIIKYLLSTSYDLVNWSSELDPIVIM
jgi:hypothetical protein